MINQIGFRTILLLIRIFLVVPTATSLSLANGEPTFALVNAYRWYAVENWGVQASLVTANPRQNFPASNAGWSYMRVLVQRVINSDVLYAEIGWLTGSQAESQNIPRAYWTTRDVNGTVSLGWGGYPGVGISYNYAVKRTSPSSWALYFNDLTTPVATVPLGWDYGDKVASGGEVPFKGQRVGPSNNNNVSYRNFSSNLFSVPCTGLNVYISDPPHYHADAITCSSWKVWGGSPAFLPFVRK